MIIKTINNKTQNIVRLTGLFTLRPLRGLGFRKTAVGLRPLCGFAPAHLGQGPMLRIALLPAPNVVNSRERYAI
jgi:hypothetical protein